VNCEIKAELHKVQEEAATEFSHLAKALLHDRIERLEALDYEELHGKVAVAR
jgi:hypothetical protein